jgi:hypothetical protein
MSEQQLLALMSVSVSQVLEQSRDGYCEFSWLLSNFDASESEIAA